MCNNAKLQHPWKMYKDEFGADVPEKISFCHYHAKFCLDPNKSHGDHLVKIKEPNEFALCNECFVQKVKRPPPHLPKFRIPGVARASRNVLGQAKLASKTRGAAGESLNEDSICDWRPNRMIIAERGLSCNSKVFRNPESRALCKQCGWHLTECCLTHKDADPSKKRIAIPNEFGLCVAHYVSKFGHPPKKLALPYPGMEKREKEEEKIMTIEEEVRGRSLALAALPTISTCFVQISNALYDNNKHLLLLLCDSLARRSSRTRCGPPVRQRWRILPRYSSRRCLLEPSAGSWRKCSSRGSRILE